MSEYDSSTTTFTAIQTPTDAELIRTAINEHLGGRMREWVSSADLTRLAGSTNVGTGNRTAIGAQATNLNAALLAMPTAHALVSVAQPTLLAQSTSSLDLAAQRTRLGDKVGAARAAGEAQAALRSAIEATAARLAIDERTVTVEGARRSLDRMGFHLVSQASGTRSQALWAVRGDQAVAVLVQDGGAVETDVVGCPGDTCASLMDEFRTAMAKEGVVLDLAARSPHGDERGGSLVARARAAGTDSVAAGLVQQFEQPVRPRSSSVKTDRARLRTEEAR